ncbi:zinc ABC transporter substrate-binding protein [Kocuria sp. JC486]|uniref:metal ABC transporter solute-binding protein, Zn/Mn family n=1 Tax=Kocuria sp. JC486 TaxID=1970736 RepID=UPI001FD8679E|nr:zinc ABC transporter substrate-binding protein [Kocuria sp. JC486]
MRLRNNTPRQSTKPRRGSPSGSSTRRGVAALVGIGSLALAGCSGGQGQSDDDVITVVTTTATYADVVEQVAGDRIGSGVEVIPVIDSPTQDPHSYEATPQDKLTVRDADLVVLNGGGYDAFMEDLAAETDAPVVDAVEVSGLEEATDSAGGHGDEHDDEHADEHSEEHSDEHSDEHGASSGHDHGSFNEHVWYDLDAMGSLAGAVAGELGALDAGHAEDYTGNAEDFRGSAEELHHRVTELGLSGDYLATEPVADYLLEDAGLHNVTPTAFAVAVEDGTDASPLVYEDVRTMITGDGGGSDLALLAYNEQTSTGQSDDLRAEAEGADLPVLAYSESVPDDQDYLSWMSENVDHLERTLGKGTAPTDHPASTEASGS